METHAHLRDLLARLLTWEDAHVSFDTAVAGIPVAHRGTVPSGLPHSPWQLVDHLRRAQHDILDFCVNDRYVHTKTFPDDYWPKDPAPPNEAAWQASIDAYVEARARVQQLAHEVDDLTAKVPTGEPHHTYLRAILLVADHAAYHLGQIVAVRRALGVWP